MKQRDGILFGGLLYIALILTQFLWGVRLSVIYMFKLDSNTAVSAVNFDTILLALIAGAFITACAAVLVQTGSRAPSQGKGGVFALFLCALLFVAFSLPVFALSGNKSLSMYLMLALSEVTGILIPAVIYLMAFRIPFSHVRLNKFRISEMLAPLLISLFIYPFILLCNALWHLLIQQLGITPSASPLLNTKNVIANLVFIGVFPAFIEEFAFRGIILNELAPYGGKNAVVLTGIMFALLHLDIAFLPSHVFLGILLSALVYHTGSLYPGIFAHFAINAISVLANAYADTPAVANILEMFYRIEVLVPVSIFGLALAAILIAFMTKKAKERGYVKNIKVPAAPKEAQARAAGEHLIPNAAEPLSGAQSVGIIGAIKPKYGLASYLPIAGGILILSLTYVFISVVTAIYPF